MMRMWLDDVRPAPDGWVWVKTVPSAIQVLKTGAVEEASLDHDLGHCQKCSDDPTTMCSQHKSGYELVKWMAEHAIWPKQKPRVHSSNPAGAANMRATIDRYWTPNGGTR